VVACVTSSVVRAAAPATTPSEVSWAGRLAERHARLSLAHTAPPDRDLRRGAVAALDGLRGHVRLIGAVLDSRRWAASRNGSRFACWRRCSALGGQLGQ
jgi:hypothetical protein